MTVIGNGKNTPLNTKAGTVPDVGGALLDWFQPMTFTLVSKVTQDFQVIETAENIDFQGVIQPLTGQRLMLKPEGQRAWSWFLLHANPALVLSVDDVVVYLGVQTRVMSRKDYQLYGYVEYELVQDWGGSGPEPTEIPNVADGGDSETTSYQFEINGGNA